MLKAGNFRKSLKYSLIMTLIVILIVISRAEQVKKSKDKENDLSKLEDFFQTQEMVFLC